MTDALVPGLPELDMNVGYLGAFLRECGAVDGDVTAVRVLAGGISNVTMAVETTGGACVVRRRPFGTVPAKAHDMHHEFRVLSALSGTELPVPRVFAYCEDESLLGAPFYAMELVAGTVPQEREDAERFTPGQRTAMSEDLVRVLAQMHALPVTDISTYREGRGARFVARQIDRWHERWSMRPHRELPIVDELASRLRLLVPDDEGVTLVHGDFRLGNLIIDFGGERPVAAILDWELSTFGNPLTDLAHLVAYWEPTGDIYSHKAQHIAKAPGFLTGDQLADLYSTLSERSVEHLPFYLAYEQWRAVVIKEGVYQRRLEIGAPQAEAEDARRGVDSHIAEAIERLARV